MASSLFGKVSRWASTPQGRRAISQATQRAQQMAKDPATKARVGKLRSRITGGDKPGGGPGMPPAPRP